MNATMKTLEDALTQVDLNRPESITEASNMALGMAGVKAGSDVAVIDDPTFPMAGLKAKVKSVSVDTGLATVELANGNEVQLMVNQLIAL